MALCPLPAVAIVANAAVIPIMIHLRNIVAMLKCQPSICRFQFQGKSKPRCAVKRTLYGRRFNG